MSDGRALRVTYEQVLDCQKRRNNIDVLFKGTTIQQTTKDTMSDNKPDLVNHPPHYTQHPSGVECIQVTEHFNFCRGNAIKYIWRAGEKGSEIEDLKKAAWYINREIARLEQQREAGR